MGNYELPSASCSEIYIKDNVGKDTPNRDTHDEDFFNYIRNRNIFSIVAAIKDGADINMYNLYHVTPLLLASRYGYGDGDVAELLLYKGTNINDRDIDGWTPLMRATNYGDIDMVKLLIDRGVDINMKSRYGGDALSFAISRGSLDIVELVKSHTERGCNE